MPTYRLTARNQFRSPSGAVGEAPDGPGAMATLLDDVDNIIGVGGAEYCANTSGLAAIPSSRRFLGKLAYTADTSTAYRWVGIGGTALGSNDTTHGWQAWEKPAADFAPSFSTGLSGSTITLGLAKWGIAAGLLWVDVTMQLGTPIWSSTTEAQFTLPSAAVATSGDASGSYFAGGSTANNNVTALFGYVTGATGALSTVLRLRALVASAAGASVKQNILGSAITGAAGDTIRLQFRGMSALVG